MRDTAMRDVPVSGAKIEDTEDEAGIPATDSKSVQKRKTEQQTCHLQDEPCPGHQVVS